MLSICIDDMVFTLYVPLKKKQKTTVHRTTECLTAVLIRMNVCFRIGCTPVVAECDGEYKHESRRNLLQWVLPIIDRSNKTGAMEFSASSAVPSDFFPLTVSFVCKQPYADLKVNYFCDIIIARRIPRTR